jgi:hypothetical protein
MPAVIHLSALSPKRSRARRDSRVASGAGADEASTVV